MLTGITAGSQICYTVADVPGFDPTVNSMCFLIWDDAVNSAASIPAITLEASLTVTASYAAIPAINFPSIIAHNDCLFGTPVQINCNCTDCPTVVTVLNDTGTSCPGATDDYATWRAAIATANPLNAIQDPSSLGTIVYSSITPVAGTTLPDNIEPDGTHTGTSCNNETQMVMAYLYCDVDGSGTVNTGDSYTLISTYTLTIYPPAQAPILIREDATCTYSYTPSCVGDTFLPEMPTVIPGTDPVAFTVEVSTANGCVATFTVDSEACPADCPVTSEVIGSGTICSGDLTTEISSWQTMVAMNSLNMIAIMDGNTAAAVIFSTSATATESTPPIAGMASGIHSGTGCNSETQTTLAYLLCFGADATVGGGDDSYFLLGTHTLTIYPPAQAPTLVRDDATCTYSYTPACAGDTFSPATILSTTPSTDPDAFEVFVTTANGCTATHMVDPEACPSANCPDRNLVNDLSLIHI